MKLSCRDCGSAFHVSGETLDGLGEQGFCPFCGATIVVPRPPDDLDLTGSVTEARQPSVRPRTPERPAAKPQTIAWSSPVGTPAHTPDPDLTERLTSPGAPRPAPQTGRTAPRTAAVATEEAPTTDFGRGATVGLVPAEMTDPFKPADATDEPAYGFDPLGGEQSLLDDAWPETSVRATPDPSDEVEAMPAFGWSNLGPRRTPEPSTASTASTADDEPAVRPAVELATRFPSEPLGPKSIDDLLELAGRDAAELDLGSDGSEPALELELDLDGPAELAVIRDLPAQPMEVSEASDSSAPDLFAGMDEELRELEPSPVGRALSQTDRAPSPPPGAAGPRWRVEREGPDATPVELAELLRRIREGELSAGARVARPGEGWVCVEDVPALRRYLSLYGRQDTGGGGKGKAKKGFWRRLTGG